MSDLDPPMQGADPAEQHTYAQPPPQLHGHLAGDYAHPQEPAGLEVPSVSVPMVAVDMVPQHVAQNEVLEEAPLALADHDYDSADPAQRSVRDSQEFPEIPPLEFSENLETEVVVGRGSAADRFYQEGGAMYSAPRSGVTQIGGTTYRSAGDHSKKLVIGGQNYQYPGQRAALVAHRNDTYASPSYTMSNTYYGGGAQGSYRRTVQPVNNPPGGATLRKPVLTQRPSQITPHKTMTRVMPPMQQAEPPHRALLTGKAPTTITPQYQQPPQEEMMSATPRAAPLLVAARGAKPVIRGRFRRKDGDPDDSYEDLSRISPRKVNFLDGSGSSTSATPGVNLVVGPPPLPGSAGSESISFRHDDLSNFQDTDAEVQHHLDRIQQQMEDREPRAHMLAAMQHREPLAGNYMDKMNQGEICFRTLPFTETIKLKGTFPDVPMETVPEPRPRGRPRGSTNRTRLSSQGTMPPNTPGMVATSVSPKRMSPVKVGSRSPIKMMMGDEIEQLAPLKPPQVPVLPPEIASHPLIESPPRKDFLPTAAYSNGYEQQPEISLPVREPSPEEESDADSEVSATTAEEDWGDYTTRCWCEMSHNDEYMISCDKCDVWQHMKCVGIPTAKPPKNYLCEQCNPRKMKLTKGQAKDYQQKKLAELTKEKQRKKDRREKRRAEKRKAREEARALKAKKRRRTEQMRPISTAQYKKFTEIKTNEYSPRAKELLSAFQTTHGADFVVENIRKNKPKYSRMVVSPDVEGLVAVATIPKNDLVIEYLGHVSFPSECPGREKVGSVQPHCVLYSGASLDAPLVIDGRRKGGDSRFVRRSCKPNTVLKHVILNGNLHVLLNATEEIEQGTEITIPFDSDYLNCPRPLECTCTDPAACPIVGFNHNLCPSPPPSPPKRKSSAAPPAKKTPASAAKAKPKSTEKKAPGRPPRGAPMIKLRRVDKDNKAQESTAEEDEAVADVAEGAEDKPKPAGRAARAQRRSEGAKEGESGAESGASDTEAQPPNKRGRRSLKETPTPKEEPKSPKKVEKSPKKEPSPKKEASPKKDVSPKRGRGRGGRAKKEETPSEKEEGEVEDSDKEEEPEGETEEQKTPGRRGRGAKSTKSPEKPSPASTGKRTSGRQKPDTSARSSANRPSREERKLQHELAMFKKLEEAEGGRKSGSPDKPEPRKRRASDRHAQQPATPAERSTRGGKGQSKRDKDSGDDKSIPSSVPPRKRWLMEQKMKEEEEAAAARVSSPPQDFSQGRKGFLLRRAQADREKEEPAPPDPAPSSPQAQPSRMYSKSPQKQRRTDSEHEPATPTARVPPPRFVEKSENPRELLKKLGEGCSKTIQPYELPSGPEWPPVTQVKARRLTLEEYKKRRMAAPLPPSETPEKSTRATRQNFMPSLDDTDTSTLTLGPIPDPNALHAVDAGDINDLRRRIFNDEIPPPPQPPIPELGFSFTSPLRASRQQATRPTPGSASGSAQQRGSLADRLKEHFSHLM